MPFNALTFFVLVSAVVSSIHEGRPYFSGKDAYSPDVDSSPAPSSNDPQHGVDTRSKQSSRGNSFEIENLLKTAGEVSFKNIVITPLLLHYTQP